jgi:hypothetical protein
MTDDVWFLSGGFDLVENEDGTVAAVVTAHGRVLSSDLTTDDLWRLQEAIRKQLLSRTLSVSMEGGDSP